MRYRPDKLFVGMHSWINTDRHCDDCVYPSGRQHYPPFQTCLNQSILLTHDIRSSHFLTYNI